MYRWNGIDDLQNRVIAVFLGRAAGIAVTAAVMALVYNISPQTNNPGMGPSWILFAGFVLAVWVFFKSSNLILRLLTRQSDAYRTAQREEQYRQEMEWRRTHPWN